jgi:hypothetical protein
VSSCKKKMEMQQMMELLLKEVRAWGEKIDAETRAIEARMEAMQEELEADAEKMVSAFKPEIGEETMAC